MKCPERFHYSKPTHRLGEITALPDEEGHILSEVNLFSSLIQQYSLFIFRQLPMQHTTTKVIMVGIIHLHQCRLYLWLAVLHSIQMFKLIHSIMLIFIILHVEFLILHQIHMLLLALLSI